MQLQEEEKLATIQADALKGAAQTPGIAAAEGVAKVGIIHRFHTLQPSLDAGPQAGRVCWLHPARLFPSCGSKVRAALSLCVCPDQALELLWAMLSMRGHWARLLAAACSLGLSQAHLPPALYKVAPSFGAGPHIACM